MLPRLLEGFFPGVQIYFFNEGVEKTPKVVKEPWYGARTPALRFTAPNSSLQKQPSRSSPFDCIP
jgi:hypothetical protein